MNGDRGSSRRVVDRVKNAIVSQATGDTGSATPMIFRNRVAFRAAADLLPSMKRINRVENGEVCRQCF